MKAKKWTTMFMSCVWWRQEQWLSKGYIILYTILTNRQPGSGWGKMGYGGEVMTINDSGRLVFSC